jgi:hypothetical protein
MAPCAIDNTPCVEQSSAPAAMAWTIGAVPWNCTHSTL